MSHSNINCPLWCRCLEDMARRNLPWWDCSQCEHRDVQVSGEMADTEGAVLLCLAVCVPGFYQKYRKWQRFHEGAEP